MNSRDYNEWQRHVRREIAYGRWQPYVDAEPARRHVRALMDRGLSLRQIRDLAGVSETVLRYLVYPDHSHNRPPSRRIRPAHAEAILAANAGPLPPSGRVPAAGTRRRLQALAVAGWPMEKIAPQAGCSWRVLSRIAGSDQPVVMATLAAKVARAHKLLATRPGPSPITRSRAQRRGWIPSGAWDDGLGEHGIDNPDATPLREFLRPRTKQWRSADLVAEVEELAELEGLNRDQAAQRLGVTRDAIDCAYRRARIYAQREQGSGEGEAA